jgi:hypothetical protein
VCLYKINDATKQEDVFLHFMFFLHIRESVCDFLFRNENLVTNGRSTSSSLRVSFVQSLCTVNF